MKRLPAIALACVLAAFVMLFIDMDTGADFWQRAFDMLISAALCCGVVLAVKAAITGKDPLN